MDYVQSRSHGSMAVSERWYPRYRFTEKYFGHLHEQSDVIKE